MIFLENILDLPSELLESRYEESKDNVVKNRITFAKSYAKKSGLISNHKRGIWTLNDTGREVLDLPTEEGKEKALQYCRSAISAFADERKARAENSKYDLTRWHFIYPALKVLSNLKGPTHEGVIFPLITDSLGYTEEQLNSVKNGSPIKTGFYSEISWSLSYLKSSGALDRPKPASYEINALGLELLELNEEEAVGSIKGLLAEHDQSKLPDSDEVGSVLSLGEELLFDPAEFFVEVAELLKDRPQAIFYGPPGTGKTWAALQLAEVLAGDDSRTKLVQFHPSYAYEDFIEGWRPNEEGGFEITDGPLKRMAADAADNPDETFVLVIDEINRANLSKVLGELFFLLEYRDRSITLQYSDGEFKLPENLKIIGTMNTADRSIALVDAALRRRFHFHGFFPDREPIQGLLQRWLVDKGNEELLWVADLVDAANSKLDERDLAIGPSHFMKDDLDEEKVQRIWKRSIMPYIEDHYFDNPDQATEFTYDQLRNTKP